MGVIFLEPWAREFYAALPPPIIVTANKVDVLGVSRLTVDADGISIWIDLCAMVESVTGKVHRHKPDPDAWFRNDPGVFVLPEGEVEAFMHEFCHWIIASPEDRLRVNLGLGKFREDFTKADGLLNEERVWALEAWIFSPFIGELALALLISPDAHIRPCSRWINPPMEVLSYGLQRASETGLDVECLRDILGRWVRWIEDHPE